MKFIGVLVFHQVGVLRLEYSVFEIYNTLLLSLHLLFTALSGNSLLGLKYTLGNPFALMNGGY